MILEALPMMFELFCYFDYVLYIEKKKCYFLYISYLHMLRRENCMKNKDVRKGELSELIIK